MTALKRIQRRRVKGWRAPAGAIDVGPGSKWRNPIVVSGADPWWSVDYGPIEMGDFSSQRDAMQHAAACFRWQLANHPTVIGFTADDVRAELAGHDLMCDCPLDKPCHADVLLELANGDQR